MLNSEARALEATRLIPWIVATIVSAIVFASTVISLASLS